MDMERDPILEVLRLRDCELIFPISAVILMLSIQRLFCVISE